MGQSGICSKVTKTTAITNTTITTTTNRTNNIRSKHGRRRGMRPERVGSNVADQNNNNKNHDAKNTR